MTTEIVYVHWCSNHAFTAGVNARQPQVKPYLASTVMAGIYLTHDILLTHGHIIGKCQ
jgi:hypothetical protein